MTFSKCIGQNSLYGSAQLHRSPSKGHISPKTVNSSFKTKSFSHINSQCPQNENFLLNCSKKKNILKALNTFVVQAHTHVPCFVFECWSLCNTSFRKPS